MLGLGEKYFMETFVDGDMAANNGGYVKVRSFRSFQMAMDGKHRNGSSAILCEPRSPRTPPLGKAYISVSLTL